MSIQSLLPDGYGFAAFLWIPGMYMFHWVLSGSVISARKEFNVKLPNLYAVPGVHKKADEFNAVQRGHMNMMETNHYLQLMALFGSCYSSNAAYANAVGGVANMVGCSLYMKAYKKYYNVNEHEGNGGQEVEPAEDTLVPPTYIKPATWIPHVRHLEHGLHQVSSAVVCSPFAYTICVHHYYCSLHGTRRLI